MAKRLAALRQWMKDEGCSQDGLAARLECSAAHVSMVLSGRGSFSVDMAMRAEMITGIPATELVTNAKAKRLMELYAERTRAIPEIVGDMS